jgi:hypothetical protein
MAIRNPQSAIRNRDTRPAGEDWRLAGRSPGSRDQESGPVWRKELHRPRAPIHRWRVAATARTRQILPFHLKKTPFFSLN